MVTISASNILSSESALDWAQKAPDLLRLEMDKIPGDAAQVGKNAANFGTSYRIAGIGVGAVLAAASFTKYIPGKWKWLTGGAAVGSGLMGLYMGSKADDVVNLMQHSIPELKNAVLKYADAIEKEPALRQQLADYLIANVTPQEAASRNMESLVLGKAILFGQDTAHLDIKTLAKGVAHDMRADRNSIAR